MSFLLPTGYTTLRDTARMIECALFAGRPEHLNTLKFREAGFNVRDGDAARAAMAELWESVDRGQLQVLVIAAGRTLQITPEVSRQIPLLRRVCGLTYLRPGHRLHRKFVAWFGSDFAEGVLVVRDGDAHRVARAVMRTRRRKAVIGKRRPGRPSLFKTVAPAIQILIGAGKWNPTLSLKTLTRQVAAELPPDVRASEDTVTRTLDQLHRLTGDRRFQRVRLRRRRIVH